MRYFYVLFYIFLLVQSIVFYSTYGYAFLKCDKCDKTNSEWGEFQNKKYHNNDKSLISLLWRRTVACGFYNFYTSFNSDYDNRCYVFIADCCGVIKKLDINTGRAIWSKDLFGAYLKKNRWLVSCNSLLFLSSNITVNKCYCYIASELAGVYAINVNTGKSSWVAPVFGEVISPPIVSHGVVLIYTNNGVLYALDEQIGIIRWKVNVDIPSGLSFLVTPLPVVSSGIVVFGDSSGVVSACDINNGQLIWQKKISNFKGLTDVDRLSDVVAPVIVDNVVYAIAYNGNMVALDVFSGSLLWSRDIGSLTNIIVENGIIYLIDQESHIFACSANTGTIIWSQERWMHNQLNSILSYKDYILFGDSRGYLYWLYKKDGIFFRKDKVAFGYFKPFIMFNTVIICEKNGVMSTWRLIDYD